MASLRSSSHCGLRCSRSFRHGIARPHARTTSSPEEERPVDHKPAILVVEDDQHISTLIMILLEDAGYTVVTADTGMAGLERASAQDLDLVVLDWILPDLQGVYLCRMIKEQTSK